MKKIINQKRYNTKSSTLIGESDNLKLYLKTTGEFFYHDTDAEKLIPINLEDAEKFARNELGKDLFEVLNVANDEQAETGIKLRPHVFNYLKIKQAKEHKFLSVLINDIIEEYMQQDSEVEYK